MTGFSRALVALDLSTMDKKLMDYLASMVSVLDTKKVYFVHIIPDFNMP